MKTVNQEADEIINGQRRVDYGDVLPSFEISIGFWNVYLTARLGIPVELKAEDQVNMMVLLKVARASNGFHRDSYVDIAGYAGCAELIKNEREKIAAYDAVIGINQDEAEAKVKKVTPQDLMYGDAPDVIEAPDGRRWKNISSLGGSACVMNYNVTGVPSDCCWEQIFV